MSTWKTLLFGLEKTAGTWRIARMKLETYYQTGNRNLLRETARNAPGSWRDLR